MNESNPDMTCQPCKSCKSYEEKCKSYEEKIRSKVKWFSIMKLKNQNYKIQQKFQNL